MAEKQIGMGKGLAAILSSTAVDASEGEAAADLRQLPVDLITPNPGQPRKNFDQDSLAALAESLTERGVLQPILVRPLAGGRYELVAGERRWRAAQIAGLERVPAVVADRSDGESLEDAVIENMAREDLNPVEEARAVAALVEELGLTREQVGRRVGRSRVAISNLLRLLDLPHEALEMLERGQLTEGHGKALLLADDHGDRRRLARDASGQGWSVRVTEDRARQANGAGRVAKKGRAAVHPDAQAAAEEMAAALGKSLGAEVKVRPSGTGFRAEVAFADLDEGLKLAKRLAKR